MSFFKKLGGNIQSAFKKASGGLDTTLRKVGNTAGSIGQYVDKASPYLSMINPELGVGASQLSQGLRQGQSVIKDVRGINNAVRSGNISGAIQKAKDVSQQQMPSISFA
jgi:hypothetical protein